MTLTSNKKVYVIAEIGVNHNGSIKRAKEMIKLCKINDADAVKFQVYKAKNIADTFVSKAQYQKIDNKTESQYEMLKKYELNDDDFLMLYKYATKLGIDFISTAADTIALIFLNSELKLKTIKIGSSDITNIQLLINAGRTKKNIIISCGLSTIENIDIALSALCYGYNKKDFNFDYKKDCNLYLKHDQYLSTKVSLLHCTTDYPAPLDELNLTVINTLSKKYKTSIGYSDHSNSLITPIIATSKNISMIEVHVTMNKSLKGPDHKSSLNFKEFSQYVANIRKTELMTGSFEKKITSSERINLLSIRKNLVYKNNMRKGQKISEDDLTAKRTKSGISAIKFFSVINAILLKSVKKDTIVKLKDYFKKL
jgi:sialic acid synthase SpsE